MTHSINQKWNVGAKTCDQTVALILLYGYPTFCWPGDHTHQNRCSKISHHTYLGNRWYCQFPKAKIEVLTQKLMLIKLQKGPLLHQNGTSFFNPLLSERLKVATILLAVTEAIIWYFWKAFGCLLNNCLSNLF